MTSLEVRILEMLIRVRQFGVAHAEDFPASSRGSEFFQAVTGFIEAIEIHSTTFAQHTRVAREKTTQKNVACGAVRAILASLARTSRGMERLTPGVIDKFKLPDDRSEQGLLAAARAVATEAEPHKDEFVKRGLPANFIQQLVSYVEDAGQSVDSKAQRASARVLSKAAVRDATRNGRLTVRELDAVVRNVYVADTSVRAEWASASHIERAARRTNNAPPPADNPPQPV